jgi:transglutaminase-like putative cysteine protease
VLRDRIVPPFDINEYPSPLVAFRKYTKAANNLYDQTLFTVTGLPAGATVRIASLDDYDGLVWGASNGVANDGFQRVGAVISPPSGPPVTVRVHITAAYAAQPDLSAWVPVSGTLVSLDVGPQASTLHVNRAAEDAIVTGRLRAGDTYTFTSEVTTPVMPADVQPYSVPALTEDAQSLLGGRIAAWTAGAAGRGAQLKAVADYLRNTGAYSDGGKDEGMYLPGHSLGRLSSFVNGPQPVGDDEQYAAVYALVANDLGIPARVVFGARLEADGSVRGKDVHAWVEVHVADGSWVPIPESTFMPDQSRHPDQQPPQDTQNVKAAVVPPPNAVHKPTSVTDSQTNETVHPPRPPGRPSLLARIWALLAPILTWAGPPLLLAALFAVAVLGRKWRRRRRRRTAGSTANRHAGGWREIVDLACDAGLAMPAGQTRQQQADRILAPGQPVRPGRHRNRSQRRASALTVRVDAGRALLPPYPPETADAIRYLADVADLAVYGPDDPDEQAVRAYWSHIDSARKTMLQRYGRRRRTLIRLNLASIRSRP